MQQTMHASHCMHGEDPQLRRSHFFNSYFLSKLTENSYNYPGVRRWTKKAKVDIFTLDKVIMPANVGNMHWCLAVIYVQERRIQYYDSMGGRGTTFLNALERWLEDEHKDKKGAPLGATWTKVPTIDGTPQQENGCDCGVFTCMFADYISEDLPLEFGQDHMQHFRRSLALQLLQGKAL
ncbi:hypothetical protein JKP88DRAFT_307968 [Tribonema minus]|uniref:Ubiquitin-like protease family profile domain-containing protein n=1 Tax=Tribonema minus TaxID=303371 RepID=A0A836CHU4_9STRA|nr:hypothetical protein JKP88DRAFT_307968 [Tribonema minus]